jgi:hypothetical protein
MAKRPMASMAAAPTEAIQPDQAILTGCLAIVPRMGPWPE